MEATYKPLNSDKWSLVHWKIMDMPVSFMRISSFFNRAFEYGGGSKFWGYAGTNVGPLCAGFSTFVYRHTFADFFILIVMFDTSVFSWHDNGKILKP
jgi:hypothetical protein